MILSREWALSIKKKKNQFMGIMKKKNYKYKNKKRKLDSKSNFDIEDENIITLEKEN